MEHKSTGIGILYLHIQEEDATISIITQGIVNTNINIYSGVFIGLKAWDISGTNSLINIGEVGASRFNFVIDGTLVNLASQASLLRLPGGSTIVDSNGNALSWTDVITGIVKDANGVPRNVVSNIVF